MPESKLLDIFGFLEGVTVRITQQPRHAFIDCQIDGKLHTFRFVNPEPLVAIIQVFDECWNIRVIDLNAKDRNCLEFGRYRVELWDEDNPIADFIVDSFEHWSDDS